MSEKYKQLLMNFPTACNREELRRMEDEPYRMDADAMWLREAYRRMAIGGKENLEIALRLIDNIRANIKETLNK